MKNEFHIERISKKQAKTIVLKYHYLKDISHGFKSGFNYGLFNTKLVGVCIFTGFPVPELSKGLFGLEREDQDGLFELSRLCLHPKLNEYNITSWFVARCIKQFRKDTFVRAILAYADSDFHTGTVYQALNFLYYGLTDEKKDFWIKQENEEFKKHSRGKIRDLDGEWRPRSRKHRYLIVYDSTLNIKWNRVVNYPKILEEH